MAVLDTDQEELTACQQAVQTATSGSPTLPLPPGAYVPQCDENGEYRPLQHHGSTGNSWCVTREGIEIPGTRTPPGQPFPNCSPFTGTFNSGFVGYEVDFCACRLVLFLIT